MGNRLSNQDTLVKYLIPEKFEKGCYDRGYLVPIWYVNPMERWEHKET